MSLLLKQLFQFLKLLNSETGTLPLALGCTLGFILGMTPMLSLQSILVFMILFIFRIQIGAAFLTAFFFAFIAYLLDPIFHNIGLKVLSLNSLKPIYTEMYNMPIIPYTRFYNTIVMGSAVVSIILSPFIFFISLFLIKKYRIYVVQRFKETKFFKALKATSLYQWYYSYENFYGE